MTNRVNKNFLNTASVVYMMV